MAGEPNDEEGEGTGRREASRLLTVEYLEEREAVELHLNRAGLEHLLEILRSFEGSQGEADGHFLSDAWGGDDLTSEKVNVASTLIHRLDIRLWPD